MTKVENRDPVKTYNKVALVDLASLMPVRLALLSSAADLDGRSTMSSSTTKLLTALGEILRETELCVWQAYFRSQLLAAFCGVLIRLCR